MNKFNNFFNDDSNNSNQSNDNQSNNHQSNNHQPNNNTPVFRTPEPIISSKKGNVNIMAIISMIAVLIMCVAILVNVIVLSVLKDNIARDYALSLESTLEDAYQSAIDDALDKNINQDIIDSASKTVSEIVSKAHLNSVAIINATINNTTSSAGSAFLITDKVDGTRYMLTNAHVVSKKDVNNFGNIVMTISKRISATFNENSTTYFLEVVSIGDYSHKDETSNPQKPDLALLRFIGNSPSDSEHPSIKIAPDNDYANVGDSVAVIGNPYNIGLSISTGVLSNKNPQGFENSVTQYYVTESAINSGNSGGPMIDRNCALLGVVQSKLVSTSASTSIENIGFVISPVTIIEFLDNSKTVNLENKTLNIPYILYS